MEYEQQCIDMYMFFNEEGWSVFDISEEFCCNTELTLRMIEEGKLLCNNNNDNSK